MYSGVPEPASPAWSTVMPSRVMPRASRRSGCSRRLLPKSVSRGCQPSPRAATSRLAGFRSLCSTPTPCAAATVSAILAKNPIRSVRSIVAKRSPSAAHSGSDCPPYSHSRKNGADSKFQSSTRVKSSRSPRVSRSTRDRVASRLIADRCSPSRLNLNTRRSWLRGCLASQTSLPRVCPSARSSRKCSRPGTGWPASSRSTLPARWPTAMRSTAPSKR